MDIIVGLVIIAILSGAVLKIRSEKKKGAKCVGCPYSVSSGESSPCSCSHK